ncbi:MAG TPA: histidine phosphatase family protein [bacterium]|jgi:broad specificity phosphatase PhoE|nr:histidine phosphatase family protein [bacterium]
MSVIYVVRHGQDQDNANHILNGHRNESLTPIGREQAKTTGVRLRDKEIDFVYASPTLRTRQTAEIIAEIVGLETIGIEADLIERDFGVLTGKPVADIPKYCKKFFVGDRINYFLEGEGVESFPKLLTRVKRLIKKIVARHPTDNVLLVTHGDAGKMIEAAWYGWTWEQALMTPYFENADIIELKK